MTKEAPHGKKARTKLKRFLKKPRDERSIEFTSLGVPTGENAPVFQSHLTYVAIEALGCSCHEWKKLNPKTKKEMWDEVKV